MFNITTLKIAKNTIYQLIGKVISMSITILVTVLVTRNYGPDGYGSFSLMQSFPALFFIIVDFGLNAISVREVSRNESKIYSYFVNILIFRVVLSLAFALVLGLLLVFFPYEPSLVFGIRLSLLLILTQALYATTNIVFQTKLRYDLSVLGQTAGYVFILGASLYLISQSASVTWVSFTYVVGGFITFFVNFFLIRQMSIEKAFTYDPKLIKRLFIEALPLGITFIFSQMNFKEDAILLSILPVPESFNLSSTETVGVYSLPYKVFEVSLVIPTFFMNASYPVLVRHMEEGPKRLQDTFTKVLAFLLLGGLLAGVVGYFLAPWMIDFLGGSDFSQSIAVLRILLCGAVVFYMTQPISWLIVTLSRQKYLPYIYACSVAFNLVFNLIFIPRYSFYAASFITVFSEVLILILLSFFARKAWRENYAS
ncbi:oligosaccharide flippase family protein [candidate division WWE3 bacterium]|nr:oligosaccharide flippase family protein [candidate division WWE3 bacterium]